MPLYKSTKKQTVSVGRFAISHTTGLQLPEERPELEELVKIGVLVKVGHLPIQKQEASSKVIVTPAAATAVV